MDETLQKYLNGDISEEVFNEELNKLSEEDKGKFEEKLATPEVQKKIKDVAKKELDKVAGLRKERQRLETTPEPPKPTEKKDFSTTLREENVEEAAQTFFRDFKIPAEEQQHYRDAFKDNDSGAASVNKILTDFKRIYTAEHSDELLAVRDRYEALRGGAEEYNADMGGAPGGGGSGGGSEEKFEPEVLDWVRESKKQGITITPEAAKKVLDRGMTRKLG